MHRSYIFGGLGAIYGAAPSNDLYVNQSWFQTVARAWTAERFSGFFDADSLVSGSGAVGGMRSPDNNRFVFYIEGSGSTQTIDLSAASSGSLSVKRIDLAQTYSEDTTLADLPNSSNQSIPLPYSSDWLIVIGE